MTQAMLPYTEWKNENHLALLEKCYASYGPKFDEYEDFIEAEYAKASKAHQLANTAPSP